ncbi:MAG: Rieske 2Fe-2S domain-containing protein [Actinomycetota bacterium]
MTDSKLNALDQVHSEDNLNVFDSSTTRRDVLRGAGVALAVGSGGAIAGCGDNTTPASGNSSGAATSPPATGASEGLATTSEIPVGGGKIFSDAKVVVTQPEEGTFKAFSSMCTHKQCSVTNVSEEGIQCVCHNSSFALTDGAPTQGPATAALPAKNVTVTDGMITVT